MSPILIIIPAYQASATIGHLIARIRETMLGSKYPYELLVVNDGSTDHTAQIVTSAKGILITNSSNRGKGSALRSGFTYAEAHRFETIVTMDADLQHDPAVLPSLLDHFFEHQLDMAVGARSFTLRTMAPARVVSNRISSFLIRMKTGLRIPDSQCGYRVIRTSCLKNLTLNGTRYELESELLIRLARNGARIGHLPIPTIYAGESSHIHHLRDTWRFIRMYLLS